MIQKEKELICCAMFTVSTFCFKKNSYIAVIVKTTDFLGCYYKPVQITITSK